MKTLQATADMLGRIPKYADRGPCVSVPYRPTDADDVPLRYSRAKEGAQWGAALLGPLTAGVFALLPAALGLPVPLATAMGTGLVIGSLLGLMVGGISGAAEVDRGKLLRDHGRVTIRAGSC